MLKNLYVRVEVNLAFEVLAFCNEDQADEVCAVTFGAVIDTVGDTVIIAATEKTKLTDHMWEPTTEQNLQLGHEFIRIIQ